MREPERDKQLLANIVEAIDFATDFVGQMSYTKVYCPNVMTSLFSSNAIKTDNETIRAFFEIEKRFLQNQKNVVHLWCI